MAADIPYDQFADCDDGYAFTAPVASFEPNALFATTAGSGFGFRVARNVD
ncbi:MAG: hypothetical protein OXQ86_04880 [Gammaproteobacteria bacterium]|nr:hypothetical protein [Gammaproteobacteria bacterium]MDE0413510.1 hypothetical protein [Gammaproteobacteria bacterium]